MNIHKITIAIVISYFLFPISEAFSNEVLKESLNNFVNEKFKTQEQDDLNFHLMEVDEEFDPESINLSDEHMFDASDMSNDYKNSDFQLKEDFNFESQEFKTLNETLQTLQKSNEKTQRTKKTGSVLVEDNILEKKENPYIQVAKQIPLLKNRHTKLIRTTIDGKIYYLIKFEKPPEATVSFKQVATFSMPEHHVKELQTIKEISNTIKKFNNINISQDFVTKNKIYIPLEILKPFTKNQ